VIRSNFLKSSIVVLLLANAANFFNYLIQIVIGRYLSPEEYGIHNSVLSLGVILNSGTMMLMSLGAKYAGPMRYDQLAAKSLMLRWSKIIVICTGLGMIVLLLLNDVITKFLQLESDSVVFAFIFGTVFVHLLSFYEGFLNGLGQHAMSNFMGLGLSILRILSTWGLLISGMGYALYTVGALSISLALSSLAAGWILYLIILKLPHKETDNSISFNQKQEFNFLLPSFLTWTGIAILSNIDIVIIKHHFDATSAGHFTQAAIIARIGFFATGALTMVLLPEISNTKTQQPKHLVRTALLISGGISGMFSLLCWIAPDFLIHIFFSSQASDGSYLPVLSVNYALVAILSLLFTINLERGNYLSQIVYFIVIIFFSIVLFVINIKNIEAFIYMMMLFLVTLLLVDLIKSFLQFWFNLNFQK
jgi:O-antigen/teichoic acid export membrane protein